MHTRPLLKIFRFLAVLALLWGQIAPCYAQNTVNHYRYTAVPYVNSVQQFSITIASGSTSNTATITAVGSGAFIIYQGSTTDQTTTNSAASIFASVTLTNSTTVTATRNSSNTDSVTVNGVVIDASSRLVQSVEFGTVSITTSNTSGTATISSVDTSRSVVFYLGSQSSIAAGSPVNLCGVVLTNATTVTATREGTQNGTQTVGFVVVQFATGTINSLQKFSPALTSANSTDSQTITAVTTANTFLAFGGISTTNTTFSNFAQYLSLTSTTNVDTIRQGTNTASRTIYYTVVEFVSGILSQNQSGTISLTGAASNTATITSASTTKTAVNYGGYSSNAGNPAQGFAKLTQTNATTITATKNTATNNDVVGYRALTFN